MLTPAGAHQICMSHQERNLTFAIEADTGEERLWAIELRHIFGRAIRLHHERGQVTSQTFARRRLLIENASPELARIGWCSTATSCRRPRPRGSRSGTDSIVTASTSSSSATTLS
jgi:hypothetical protein